MLAHSFLLDTVTKNVSPSWYSKIWSFQTRLQGLLCVSMFHTLLFVQLCTLLRIIPHAQGQCCPARDLEQQWFVFVLQSSVFLQTLVYFSISSLIQLIFTKYKWPKPSTVPKLALFHIHMMHMQLHVAKERLRLMLVLFLYLLQTDSSRKTPSNLGNFCNCLFMAVP